MDGAGLRVEERWLDQVVVLALNGAVDANTARVFSGAVDVAATKSPSMMIVDLSGVDFLESSGISVLVGAQTRLGPGVGFGVVASGALHRLLAVAGIPLLLAVSGTLDEALTTCTSE